MTTTTVTSTSPCACCGCVVCPGVTAPDSLCCTLTITGGAFADGTGLFAPECDRDHLGTLTFPAGRLGPAATGRAYLGGVSSIPCLPVYGGHLYAYSNVYAGIQCRSNQYLLVARGYVDGPGASDGVYERWRLEAVVSPTGCDPIAVAYTGPAVGPDGVTVVGEVTATFQAADSCPQPPPPVHPPPTSPPPPPPPVSYPHCVSCKTAGGTEVKRGCVTAADPASAVTAFACPAGSTGTATAYPDGGVACQAGCRRWYCVLPHGTYGQTACVAFDGVPDPTLWDVYGGPSTSPACGAGCVEVVDPSDPEGPGGGEA